jgi:hypothetical protein
MKSEQEIINILSDLKHRIFPRPFERLALKGENLVGVEIGVYKAQHALSLLKTLSVEKIYLIDPYHLYDEYTEGKKHYNEKGKKLNIAEQEAKENLKEFNDKIVWIKDYSSNCLSLIPNNLDFVYIDGNHQSPFIDDDIKNYYPKIKSGGIIGGHDYYNGFCEEHNDVVRVVNNFAYNNNYQLYVELPDWWIIKK